MYVVREAVIETVPKAAVAACPVKTFDSFSLITTEPTEVVAV